MALDMPLRTSRDRADAVVDRLIGLRGTAYGLATRFLSGREGAEDIVQQAYVAAFEHLRSKPPPRDDRAWFLTVVANTARNCLRSEAVRTRKGAGVLDAPSTSRGIDAELAALLNRAMNALAEKHRLPLALCYEQGLSHEEAAMVLNVPKRTLTRHVSEGLEELRKVLSQAGYHSAPAIIVGALAHTAPAVPASLAAMAGKALAGSMATHGPGLGAGTAASAAAKGGLAVKAIAAVMAAGVLAGAVAVVPGLMNGGEPGSPPVAAKLRELAPPIVVLTPEKAKELFGGKPAKLLVTVGYELPSDKEYNVNPAVQHRARYRHFLVDFSTPPFKAVEVCDASYGHEPGKTLHQYTGYFHNNEAFISPDGTRIVFDDAAGISVCEFKAGGPGRTAIADAKDGTTPRWWVHPKTGDEYVIYVRPDDGKSAGFAKGKTLIQKMKKGTCEPDGAVKVLVKEWTMNGGRSLDGKYMGSGGGGWAMAELKPDAVEDAFVKLLKTGNGDRCNVSISQDPAHPDRLLWMDPGHQWIYWNPHLEDPKWGGLGQPEFEKTMRTNGEAVPQPGKGEHNFNFNGQMQYSEWAVHPDFFTVVGPNNWWGSACLWQFSTKKWTKLINYGIGYKMPEDKVGGNGATHLWVGK
jgi:RNA polymerase sigma factor (sigma-70 family)